MRLVRHRRLLSLNVDLGGYLGLSDVWRVGALFVWFGIRRLGLGGCGHVRMRTMGGMRRMRKRRRDYHCPLLWTWRGDRAKPSQQSSTLADEHQHHVRDIRSTPSLRSGMDLDVVAVLSIGRPYYRIDQKSSRVWSKIELGAAFQ